jgi:hypothetical protein
MKRLFTGVLVILAVLVLGGCGGKGGPAPAPTGGITSVVPGDGYVTVVWDMSPGVDYWVFHAVTDGTSLTPANCNSFPYCGTSLGAVSPKIVQGLLNGQTYSFTVSGRTDGGPGGPGTPSVSAMPRIAGSSWIPQASTGSTALRAAAQNGAVFVAVGDNGTIYSSTVDTINGWTAVTTWTKLAASSLPATNLNTVVYGGSYLAAGAGGEILLSSDATTWTPQTSGTTSDLYALATNGGGEYVAVGAGGTILYSNGGATWVAASKPTSNALYGVTYAGGIFVAVGAGGTLLTSGDGANWTLQPVASNPLLDLKGITYGTAYDATGTGTSTFVAIGAAGALVTSTDGGASWTAQTPISTGPALNAVTYGKQFVAVGNNGAIFTSADSLAWLPQTSTPATSDNLFAVVSYANSYHDYLGVASVGYSAIGASGRDLTAN